MAESDIKIDSDFLPIVKEVLGRVPDSLMQSVAAIDEADRLQSDQDTTTTSDSSTTTAEAQQPEAAAAEGEEAPSTSATSSNSSSAVGEVLAAAEDIGAKRVSDDYLPGVPRALAAAVDYALKLDDETLKAVSRAIMGRLDIVDLVGKNTAYEVAERVSSHPYPGLC